MKSQLIYVYVIVVGKARNFDIPPFVNMFRHPHGSVRLCGLKHSRLILCFLNFTWFNFSDDGWGLNISSKAGP